MQWNDAIFPHSSSISVICHALGDALLGVSFFGMNKVAWANKTALGSTNVLDIPTSIYSVVE